MKENPLLWASISDTRSKYQRRKKGTSRQYRRALNRSTLRQRDSRAKRTLSRLILGAWALAAISAFIAGHSIRIWS